MFDVKLKRNEPQLSGLIFTSCCKHTFKLGHLNGIEIRRCANSRPCDAAAITISFHFYTDILQKEHLAGAVWSRVKLIGPSLYFETTM